MESLLLALSLGIGAGVSPGPLLTLTIGASLERGFGAGLRVASAPLLTDTPIIVAALLFVGSLPAGALTALTLAGGAFVAFLGVDSMRRAARFRSQAAAGGGGARDLWRGALVNILSPHPWIAWLSVLGPMVVALWRRQPALAIGFVALFYLGLVGSKIAIAALVAWGRRRLDERWYRVVLRACGALLVILGLLLLVQGARALYAG